MVIWLMCDERKTQKHGYITYEPSSLFLNLSPGDLHLQEGEKER